MNFKEYCIPDNIDELFQEMDSNDNMSYYIVDYEDGMEMDNIQSMNYFLESIDTLDDNIVEHEGTRVTLSHPNYSANIIVDSGGFGDFYSHGYECYWEVL